LGAAPRVFDRLLLDLSRVFQAKGRRVGAKDSLTSPESSAKIRGGGPGTIPGLATISFPCPDHSLSI
jgi:hypothetical protein